MTQTVLEKEDAALGGDPLDLLEAARRRCLEEIEFHEAEKDRHDVRIGELLRVLRQHGGGVGRRKSRRRRRQQEKVISSSVIKGRFDANDGQTVSVGRLIVDYLRSRPGFRATTSEIETHLTEKGRPCKPGVALSRLLEDKYITKIERGVYELRRRT